MVSIVRRQSQKVIRSVCTCAWARSQPHALVLAILLRRGCRCVVVHAHETADWERHELQVLYHQVEVLDAGSCTAMDDLDRDLANLVPTTACLRSPNGKTQFARHPFTGDVQRVDVHIGARAPDPLHVRADRQERLAGRRTPRDVSEDVDPRLRDVEVLPVQIRQMRVALGRNYGRRRGRRRRGCRRARRWRCRGRGRRRDPLTDADVVEEAVLINWTIVTMISTTACEPDVEGAR